MSAVHHFSRRIAAASVISMSICGPAGACSMSKVAAAQLPFNATELSNSDRLTIADTVIAAKRWPEVQIQAVVIAGAYVGERHIERLKKDRAENVKVYLQQLGIRRENIMIEPKTFTDQMVVKGRDGKLKIEQIVVELTPLCNGGCERLCDGRPTPD